MVRGALRYDGAPSTRQAHRGSRRSRRTRPCIGTWVGGQAPGCSLGRRCGYVFRRDILASRFREKVAENDLEAEVFALLENKYDTPLVEAEYELEAAAADPIVAQALQVPPGTPIFLIARTLYTTGNRPADYERLHYRGDLIRFVTRLARRAKASMQR